jgi:PBP1b-binding outer membrane lipoprotein LpoB
MKRIALAALVLVFATGCSSRNEDAYLDAVFENASTGELQAHTSQEFITTGEIACGMMDEGKSMPDGQSAVTGVWWSTVWFQAEEHLC